MDIFRISYESDYMKLIENIEEYDHYLISGGDGTFNKVVNILYGNNKKIPLGILPLGTACEESL
ncbi:Diacylglycerol kinase catalytic domain-containing protein [Cetobacterium ceti]|uniref:Diacylglycerol kinase catalytic domain-containing protein n=1 Tax=Cetobacterium ceti TaxID=180163 RepID=A0A1T4LQQ6_9FUSO|nr:diacylglycerol kinase family protein [Cetobacterium ceti]SJZ57089.1 Diacylglycerol kinase catalytic domain-containing protein [Cetobacterium ceti]